MDSSSSSSYSLNVRGGRSRVVPKELHHNNSGRSNLKPPGPVLKPHPSPGRNPSLSSYPSVLPDEASLPSAPSTPLRFSGVPFSWEKTPGIPKKQRKDKESVAATAASALLGRSLLPLPPSATPPTSRRFTGADEASFRKKSPFTGGADAQYQLDPFTAALVACSEEEGYGNDCKGNNNDRSNGSNLWIGRWRVPRSISGRFSFIAFYGSCKRATPISESISYLPRSGPSPYMVTNGRSH